MAECLTEEFQAEDKKGRVEGELYGVTMGTNCHQIVDWEF